MFFKTLNLRKLKGNNGLPLRGLRGAGFLTENWEGAGQRCWSLVFLNILVFVFENVKLKYYRFFLRFYVDIGINLELQFIIGLLITCWACGYRWNILPKLIPLKKKKKKIKPNGRIGRILYDPTIICDPTYDPTIFVILLQF